MKKPAYSNAIVVTRFDNFLEFLVAMNLVAADTPVYKRVDRNLVKGKTVIGKVPSHIACFADSIVNIQFRQRRNKEWDGDQLESDVLCERFIAAHEYVVTAVNRIYREQVNDSTGHRDVSELDAGTDEES